ncbi:SRPBCC domain-containing protein [Nocardia camponoti]|uniref:Activator of Hsp90 ATPase homologue 1/2-like C-terminal domain-containing protein n=1 Tax=Nocardia camponoti TaxID=1616106 RepID=A0A917QU27_9NOCA|nr:SRPBCC domain-containing protein [Nocardia camponoti]GGK68499.1 hypothetical protein GCM10011591_45820 [Nocardia camponoti]
MATTKTGIHIDAPRATVYRLLLDGDSVSEWMVPEGMSTEVHRFEPEVGGSFSITVTHTDETGENAEPQHDAYYGRFTRLIPDEQIVEALEFVTDKPEMAGLQTITFILSDADGGTQLDALHEGVPDGLSESDNEFAWGVALGKVKAIAERGKIESR